MGSKFCNRTTARLVCKMETFDTYLGDTTIITRQTRNSFLFQAPAIFIPLCLEFLISKAKVIGNRFAVLDQFCLFSFAIVLVLINRVWLLFTLLLCLLLKDEIVLSHDLSWSKFVFCLFQFLVSIVEE